MIGSWISKKIERQIKAVAKAVPFKPNNLTILGLVLIIFAVPFIFFGRHWIAGALILLVGIFDILNGLRQGWKGLHPLLALFSTR
jgi:putative Mn2+ efflux pump MntP